MTPTPDDIRKAREIALRLVSGTRAIQRATEDIAQALASEREAERERCAGIAEGPADKWGDFPGGTPERDRIAAAIRRSEP